MISVSGMSTYNALRLADATETSQKTVLTSSGLHSRAIDSFLEQVASIETVDDLVDNYEVYSFVMKAYDLEDEIFGKAMVKKILSGDEEDDDALVNKLTDSRFTALYEAMGFTEGGTVNTNTIDPEWQQAMVDKYVEQIYTNEYADQNETLGTVLELRNKADGIESYYDLLADANLTDFIYTVLNLPSDMSALDVDKQAGILEDKFDLEDLQDPEELEKLIRRYAIIKDVQDGTATANSAAVTLMSSAVNSLSSDGQFVPVTIDMSVIYPSTGYE